MFTRDIEREKSGDSNFEIRESDQNIFLATLVMGMCGWEQDTLVKFGHVDGRYFNQVVERIMYEYEWINI